MAKKFFTTESFATLINEFKNYVSNAVSKKSDTAHTHSVSDVDGLQNTLNAKVPTSRTINGKALTGNITLTASDVGADAAGASNTALASAKTYADTAATNAANAVKNDLLNGAGTAYDTLKELGDLIDDNQDAISALETVAAGKANASDLTSHTGNTTAHTTSDEKSKWNTAYTHSQAAHAPSNAQANQNAFSNIAVSGQTTVAADTTTDTVTFVGSNVSITTDATNDKVTFSVANGTTSVKGIVQLTNSTSSTSTTTAATPSAVKSAYDLANGKADKNHVHSFNDLTDRPFYEETALNPLIITWDGNRTDAPTKYSGMNDGYYFISDVVVQDYHDLIGKKVTYTLNDEVITCVIEANMLYDDTYMEITENSYIFKVGDYSSFGFNVNSGMQGYIMSVETNKTFETEVIKTIDHKYLPEHLQFGESDPVETEIVPETTFTENAVVHVDTPTLIIGQTYTVIWDGTTYDNLVCAEADGLPAIGSLDFSFTDYPFIIAIDNGECILMASTNTSHTVKVTGMVSEVVPLDRKYIAEYLDEIPVYAGQKVPGVVGAEIFNNYSSNTASAAYAHAEGSGTTASGTVSHAEGYETVAEGGYSHAQGYKTQATGSRAHAEGQGSVASGDESHAEGTYTIAAGESQHVQGKYNVEDTAGTYAHIVGNGSSTSNRKNAHTLDWSGNAWFAGDIYVGGTDQTTGTTLAKSTDLTSHTGNKSNPHGVTAAQVGALPLSGGTMTGELIVNGGDQSGVSKIVFQNGKGQITATGTQTLFGFTNNSTIAVGHSSFILAMRGSDTRPKYNSKDVALMSDVDTLDARLSTLESSAIGVLSGSEANMTSSIGEDGDIYLVTE